MSKNIIVSGIASIALLFVRWLWDYRHLPYSRLVWAISLAATGWFALSLYKVQRGVQGREAQRRTHRALLTELCEDVDKGEMIEDIVHLCDAGRVEKIVVRMQMTPVGERKLRPIYESVMEADD